MLTAGATGGMRFGGLFRGAAEDSIFGGGDTDLRSRLSYFVALSTFLTGAGAPPKSSSGTDNIMAAGDLTATGAVTTDFSCEPDAAAVGRTGARPRSTGLIARGAAITTGAACGGKVTDEPEPRRELAAESL
jgi:hypothetical protein